MKAVTSNPNHPNYKDYGGRGIIMSLDWINSYECFERDIGKRPSPSHSLERIDNNRGYEPENVIWTLASQQVKNRRNSFRINGKFIEVRTLAKNHNMSETTIRRLLKKGLPIKALSEYSKLTHYQKTVFWISKKNSSPLAFNELKKIKGIIPPYHRKRHRLYNTWHSMRQRCFNEKNKDYHNYGEVGITVCAEWSNLKGFIESILAVLGEKPSKKHQLDRIDPHGNYEPNNVRWASPKEQANNKRNTHHINGKLVNIRDLNRLYKVSLSALPLLIDLGWDEYGLNLYGELSFKEKHQLGILKNKLSQEEALDTLKSLKLSKN